MWQRNRIEVCNTKRVKEQLVIHRQSNASYQQHESWKSKRMALNPPDYQGFPSKLLRNSEATNPRCSCDTCSLIKAQAMDRYYASVGRSPLYLTSWPMVMQPQSYKEGLYPAAQGPSNLQSQHQERSQPMYPRGGIPQIFTQPQGPPSLPIEPQYTVQIPHPAVQPATRAYPTSEVHDGPPNLSPPSAFNTSPILTSKGSVNGTPRRPGGIAYDHHDLPKIVAVHSLPSSPVYVTEQLIEATLPQMGSNAPNVYANQSSDDTEYHLRPSHRVCLENRYSAIEPRADTLAETEKPSVLSEKIAEQTNVEDDDSDDKDQSNKSLDKCKAESTLSQLPISPKQYMPQHHNEAITVCQEEASRPKDVDLEMNIRTLLRRITAWQIDFNRETDDIKKYKILNLIVEARAKLEKLRLNRDYRNIPKHGVLTTGENDSSKAKEVTVGTVANDEVTTAGDTIDITVETKNDVTATSASSFESRREYVKTSSSVTLGARMTSPKIMEKQNNKMTASKITMETQSDEAPLPKITMETQSDEAPLPKMTMETQSDKVTARNITMETRSDEAASPKITMETKRDMMMLSPEITIKTEIDEDKATIVTTETKTDCMMLSPEVTIKTEIDEDKATNVTMATFSNSAVQKSDVLSTTMASKFCAETTTNSVMKTNTYVVPNANASNTMISTNVTMTISNTDVINKIDTMAKVDNYSTYRDNTRNSPSLEDSASTLSSKSSKIIMTNACQTSLKSPLLQPRIVVNLFDRVKLFDRRKKSVGIDNTAPEEPRAEAQDKNRVKEVGKSDAVSENKIPDPDLYQILGKSSSEGSQKPDAYDQEYTQDIMTGKNSSQGNVSENSFSDPDLYQIHGESSSEGSAQQLSPALSPNIIKDPFATTKIRKEQAGYTKAIESDSDDVWTMELDVNSHKAVFRRRWKRTGGLFDKKRTALESQATDENEESTQTEESFSKFTNSSPPSRKRAFLEVRILENEPENNENSEQIINEAIKNSPIFKNLGTLGPLKRSIYSMEDSYSSIYPTDQAEPQDLLANDIGMVDSPSNEPSAYSQDGDLEEMVASSEDDFEESKFILGRSLQLRESKIQRLHEKREQLLDDLKRIKANSLSNAPRDL